MVLTDEVLETLTLLHPSPTSVFSGPQVVPWLQPPDVGQEGGAQQRCRARPVHVPSNSHGLLAPPKTERTHGGPGPGVTLSRTCGSPLFKPQGSGAEISSPQCTEEQPTHFSPTCFP